MNITIRLPNARTLEEKAATITVPSHKDGLIWSQWGTITNKEWCEREAARMNRANPRTANIVHETQHGLVCVMRVKR